MPLGIGWWQTAAGALYLEEGFAGAPAGSALASDPPWTGTSGPGLQLVAGNLSLSGVLPTSPAGNMLQVTGGPETLDDYRDFSSSAISSGTVYFAALLNCSVLPTNRQFVVALSQAGATQANPPDDPYDLFVVGLTNGTGYRLGVSHTGADSSTASAILTTNTTHLVVMKYDFGAARSSLYIDPPAGALEPARADASTSSDDDGGGQNPPNLQRVILHSDAIAGQGTLFFDTLRIGQLWWDVVHVNTAAIGPANLTNCISGPATFTVTAAGTAPFTYQWRTNGVPVPGATNSFYTVAAPGPLDALVAYDTIVTDQFGSVTSRVATLTLDTVPAGIAVPPTGAVVQGSPSNGTFSVTATGDLPITYQWRVNGNNISGATRRTYTVFTPSLSATNNGYDVIVANPCGSIISSPPAHLIFPPASVTVTGPSDQVACAGNAAAFAVTTVSGTAPFAYQWRAGGIPISGATTNPLVLANVGLAAAPGLYDVIVNDANGSVTSAVAALTVSTTPPGIAVGPTNLTLRPSDTQATFTVTASGDAPLSYQWRSNGIPFIGGTSNVYTLTNLNPAIASPLLDVVIANPCGSITSAPVQFVFLHPFFASSASPGFFGGMNLATTNAPGMVLYAWSSADLSVPISSWTLEGQLAEQPLNDGSGNSYYEINVNPVNPQVYYLIGATISPPYLTPVPVAWITTDALGNQSFTWANLDISSQGVLSFPPNPFFPCGASPGFFGGMNLAATNGPGASLYAWSSTNLSQSITNWTLEGQLAEQPLNDGSGNSYYEINVNPLASLVYYVVGPTNFGPYVAPVPVEWIATDALGNLTFGVTNLAIDASGFLGLLSPPTILNQPVSLTVTAGKTASFSVSASGSAPLSYTWLLNANIPLAAGSNALLTLPGITLSQAGVYSVVVADGSGSVTSSPATLTVLPPPALGLQPALGGFQINSVGLPGDIFWLETATNVAPPISWTRVATNVADATGHVQFVDSTSAPLRFYRLVSPSSVPTLPVIVQGPFNQTVMAGKSALFNVLASGALPLSYQWYGNGSNALSAATNATLQALARFSSTYSVIITNNYGAATSAVVNLTVLSPPKLSAQFTANSFAISGLGVAGETYWVQTATNLGPAANWITIATNAVGADGTILFSQTHATPSPNQFYRLLFP